MSDATGSASCEIILAAPEDTARAECIRLSSHRPGPPLIGPSRIDIRRCVLLSAMIMSSVIALGAEAADYPGLGLAGDDEILWVFQRRADAEGHQLLFFASRRQDGAGRGRFKPLRIPGLTGRVSRFVARGVHLHVFFADGTHLRLTPTEPRWDRVASGARNSEVDLPGAVVPLAVASDSGSGMLYVAVPSASVSRADSDKTAASPDDQAGQVQPGREGDDENLAPVEPPDCSIARYEGGRWRHDRDGPDDLATGGEVAVLLATDGELRMVYRPDPTSAHLVQRVSESNEAPWSRALPLEIANQASIVGAGMVGATATLIVAGEGSEGPTLRLIRLADGASSLGPTLVNEKGVPEVFVGPLSAALFGGSIAVVTLGDGGDARVGLWSLDDGKPLEAVEPVASLRPRVAPAIGTGARQFIQYVVLMGILLVVFLWRRESVIRVVPVASGQVHARLSRRVVALLLDVTIVTPIWVPLLYNLWRRGAGDVDLAEQLELGAEALPPVMFWSWAILGAVVGLYGGVFEAATGTTPGKRIMGCSVVGVDGRRCGVGAALVRNLARVAEFHFMALALLVVLTPSRQRLGDVLARTVVVEKAAVDVTRTTDTREDSGE